MNNKINAINPNGQGASLIKPLIEIDLLITHLQTNSNKFETNGRQKINYMLNGERNIFLLHEGSVALYRRNDGMILNSESAPFIFGISNQQTNPDYLFMRSQEPSKISCLTLSAANAILAEHELWESMVKVLIYTASRIYDHFTQLSQLSSYDIIRQQLLELMNETTKIRTSVTAANYIQDRTFLSRSGTMKILSELKSGGFIDIKRGMLVDIHHLPLKY
ncbi:winged helix-turn-helix transcriptional regulator [Buttiauxella izardii]|uniref:Crp/Fnr family transcriptional regulator n=1 Tax=Buttiauxella izardii TaxID=82991 RepID=A0A3A5JXZ7_9ENTR|nr:winged helix-turn-helix transcriptional regulator [Buttiauxella izardii]RJT27896.1 Crp/Fnr family transcriptional regulator [Buttiauxella izardii]